MKKIYGLIIGLLLANTTSAKLFFPPGSDVGYIIPDDPDPDKLEDDTGWLNAIDAEEYSQPILDRGEREALENNVKAALWRTIEDRVNLAHQQNTRDAQNLEKIDPGNDWKGKWFPHPPQASSPTPDPGVPADLPDELKDPQHGVVMGVPHVKCDNAKVNLTIDWDYSPVNYTCFASKSHRLPVRADLETVKKCDDIPKDYTPKHYCMTRTITYNSTLPTFGPHRPIWPVYGEYKFVPVQRWLHSIEHGAIVVLYDPCAEPVLVHKLRKIVTGCARKHIITPYTLLTPERPLALLAWGCSLQMSTVDEKEVKQFIIDNALHGPEGHDPRHGGYKELLLKKAEYPPGAQEKDANLCPS